MFLRVAPPSQLISLNTYVSHENHKIHRMASRSALAAYKRNDDYDNGHYVFVIRALLIFIEHIRLRTNKSLYLQIKRLLAALTSSFATINRGSATLTAACCINQRLSAINQ